MTPCFLVGSHAGGRGPRFTVVPGQCLATAGEWAWLDSGTGAERERDSRASEVVRTGVTYKIQTTSKSCLDPMAAAVGGRGECGWGHGHPVPRDATLGLGLGGGLARWLGNPTVWAWDHMVPGPENVPWLWGLLGGPG